MRGAAINRRERTRSNSRYESVSGARASAKRENITGATIRSRGRVTRQPSHKRRKNCKDRGRNTGIVFKCSEDRGLEGVFSVFAPLSCVFPSWEMSFLTSAIEIFDFDIERSMQKCR